MNQSTFFYLVVNLAVLWLLSLGVVACGGTADAPNQPIISFKSLDDGSEVNLGQAVPITYEAADVKGVTQVELTINGQPIHIEAVTPPVNVFSGSYVWTPESGGSYLLQLVAFNVDGVSSSVAQVAVTVSGEAATVEPTATLVSQTTPTDTPTSVVASPTPAEAIEATATPTAEATSAADGAKPMVTTLIGLNVRAGPGTNYPVIGRIRAEETAEITGRNEVASWWQIVFDSGLAERGWIAAGAEFSTAMNADAVPVVEAPAPAEPIGSAINDKPVIDRFEADPDTITAGKNVLLSWDLRNAKEAFLRFDGQEEGVVAPGSKTVAPTKDTVYTLIARNDAGETTREITVRVSGATATPPLISTSGTFNVTDGQTIDFDSGAVQGDGGAGADFFWSAQQKEFKSRNGAIGTLINKGFAEISLADCMAASYGGPISGIDASQPIAGCYRTNEDRFGKFAITSWDLAGRLTIEWLTWRN